MFKISRCSFILWNSLNAISPGIPSLITLTQGAPTARQSHFLSQHPASLPSTSNSEDELVRSCCLFLSPDTPVLVSAAFSVHGDWHVTGG